MTIKEKMQEVAKDLDHMIQEAQKKDFSRDDYFKISSRIFDVARGAGSSGVIWHNEQSRKLHRLAKLIISKKKPKIATVKRAVHYRTTAACKLRQGKSSRFCYKTLPFVKKLSKNDKVVAHILEDSYERGVTAAQ